MNILTIYAAQKSMRLQYVLDWIFSDVLGCEYQLVHDIPATIPHNFICYGSGDVNSALCIPDSGLLWENDIRKVDLIKERWQELPIITEKYHPDYTIPFDIFSSVFFLITRYEEYYSYTPDKHCRYPYQNSVLHELQLLETPVIDGWLYQLKKLLEAQFHIHLSIPTFRFVPTYDIDIAYSHKEKGILRNLGASGKDLLKRDLDHIAERAKVLSGNLQDPYDSFSFISNLHHTWRLKPVYFILAALRTTDFDKNISPENAAMNHLIKQLSIEGEVGIHPSYFSDTNRALLPEEKLMLEKIIGRSITISRQHYIKLSLPDTYYFLIDQKIETDYSMGYGNKLGFRAGTGRSFLWYDLKNERSTTLRVHPFCFMDTTALYEEQLNAQHAFEKLHDFKDVLKKYESQLITVFHNFSLGTAKEWIGWQKGYRNFISNVV